jgi:hypothetical protein
MLKTLAAAVLTVLVSVPALAQAPPPSGGGTGTWNGLPDRFQVDTGFFRINADTNLRASGGVVPATDVSFEDDLGLSPNASTFWVDATWRLGRRHQLKFGYTKLSRDSQSLILGRAFNWDDKVYAAGLSASASLSNSITSAYYRFALIKSDRLEIGPAVGFGYLTIAAGIRATGTVAVAGGGTRSVTLDQSKSVGQMTGDVGAFFNGWLSKKVVVRGDFLYVKVTSGKTTAAVTDGRLALDAYPSKHLGFGVQYKYNKFNVDRGILDAKVGGSLTFQGPQIYASFLF